MTNEEFIKSVSLEGEIWKDVVGYEGYYMVSSFGRLASLGRLVRFGSMLLPKAPKIMSITSTNERYNKAVLKVDGTKKSVNVHRLVATAFIPNPNNYRCIDHIDGDKTNNHISNLRWCSDLINQNNPITRAKQRTTLRNKGSKFAPVKIVGIKEDKSIIVYDTICEATKDGHLQSMISECCNGNRSMHHGIKWMRYTDYENLINKSKNA
jgi:hypothetical protein